MKLNICIVFSNIDNIDFHVHLTTNARFCKLQWLHVYTSDIVLLFLYGGLQC
jgi:hypothetical protein